VGCFRNPRRQTRYQRWTDRSPGIRNWLETAIVASPFVRINDRELALLSFAIDQSRLCRFVRLFSALFLSALLVGCSTLQESVPASPPGNTLIALRGNMAFAPLRPPL